MKLLLYLQWQKALYMGLPVEVRFENEQQEGAEIKGIFSGLIGTIIPFNGWFFFYEGSYLKALWEWLKDEN